MRIPLTLCLALVAGWTFGQPGTLDLTWNPGGSGANYNIYGSAAQPDGKVIMGGTFTTYNGMPSDRLIRLNTDGTEDTTFQTGGFGPGSFISYLTLQADGKVLVTGDMYFMDGSFMGSLIRLNSDGSVDPGFNIGTYVGSDSFGTKVNTIAFQAGGKMLIGGRFISYDGHPAHNVMRMNSDGSFDPTFQPSGSGVGNEVSVVEPLADGRILVGGQFNDYNGIPKYHLVRLFSDGTLDTDFHASVNGDVRQIIAYPAGRIAISGRFTLCNGTARRSLAVLNPNGQLVGDLDPAVLMGPNGSAGLLLRQPGNKTLVAGDFRKSFGAARDGLMALNADGSLDTTFNPVRKGTLQRISTMCSFPDGKIFIAGNIERYNSALVHHLTRLNGYAQESDLAPQQERSLAYEATATPALWPNPTNGTSTHLLLSGLDPSAHLAQVQLVDLTGKVLSRTEFPVVDGRLDTELDLNNTADGMYMLQVVAGADVRTERLVIRR